MKRPAAFLLTVAPFLVVLSFAACTQTVGLTSSFCDPRSGIEPIRLTDDEIAALSSEPKRRILAVNNYGLANCGWKP